MIHTVPDLDFSWPTLGPQVCEWIEDHLVFGPGDLRGQPAVVDAETRALICRMYEVFPRGHDNSGRRRFKRCAISLRKGSAKTEKAAWIAACELHPAAPVRCVDWSYNKKSKAWEPIGGPVTDPYIPMVAYTEEQSEDLAYGALRVILELSDVSGDFDIGLERILRKQGGGKAVALASAPDARDGARTTFQHFDETHRFTLQRLVNAHKSMLANIPKRKMADPWSLETTTAPEPGTGSVAEATMEYAKAVTQGTVPDSRLFYFHREASEQHDLSTDDGVRAAVMEASGPLSEWSDIDSIVEQWRDPTSDRTYLERVWLNRLVQAGTQAFDVPRWRSLKVEPIPVVDGDFITVGLDGGQFHDSTALVATHIKTGYQWRVGLWERPPGRAEWQVPATEVDSAVRELFARYHVWRLYADPPYWQSWIAIWQGVFGKEQVIEWWTNRDTYMARAVEGFHTAIKDGSIGHDGSPDVARHIGNSRKREIGQRDEQGKAMWVIQKDRNDSTQKIDAAVASVLSWEARTDAIAAGVQQEPEYAFHVYGGRK